MSSHLAKPVATPVVITETPFDKRHCCWFCGEPNHGDFVFPRHSSSTSYDESHHLILNCPHPTISIPSCGECQKIANKAQVDNIFAVNVFVKKLLVKRYAKDLAIGINWTEEELANSEFDQGNFAGFARSAWFIYEVAKGRVNYLGWPLIVNGMELEQLSIEDDQLEAFNFDGVLYPSLSDAINHFSDAFLVDAQYMTIVLQYLANDTIDEKVFAQAVRFCRLLVNATSHERKVAFKELIKNRKPE